jgi:hypothetical protein
VVARKKVAGAGVVKLVPDPKKTKRTVGGNSPCDVQWMLDCADELSEIPDGAAPKDVQWWDVKYQWDGEAEDVNPDYFNEWRRGTRQCNGQAYIRDERGGYIMDREWNRLRRPCLRPPMLGTAVCANHGGEITHVKKAAQNRLGMAAEKAAYTLITMTNATDENGETIDHAQRIKAANSVLDRTGIKAGAELDLTLPGYQRVLDTLFTGDDETEEE